MMMAMMVMIITIAKQMLAHHYATGKCLPFIRSYSACITMFHDACKLATKRADIVPHCRHQKSRSLPMSVVMDLTFHKPRSTADQVRIKCGYSADHCWFLNGKSLNRASQGLK